MFHSSNEMAFLYGRLIKRQISHESFRARSIHACQTTRRALDLWLKILDYSLFAFFQNILLGWMEPKELAYRDWNRRKVWNVYLRVKPIKSFDEILKRISSSRCAWNKKIFVKCVDVWKWKIARFAHSEPVILNHRVARFLKCENYLFIFFFYISLSTDTIFSPNIYSSDHLIIYFFLYV